jgi:PhoH-like ATPase
MAYIRGRSIKDAFIVVDEAQNMTRIQAKTLVTRAGERTKIVLCGDPNQIDNPRLDYTSNGLIYTAEKMRDQAMVGQLTFTEDECVRSPLSKLAAKLL